MNYCWFFKFYIMTKNHHVLLSFSFYHSIYRLFYKLFYTVSKIYTFCFITNLGLIIYPINFKFKNIEDFMILPVLAISIFNIVNIFI